MVMDFFSDVCITRLDQIPNFFVMSPSQVTAISATVFLISSWSAWSECFRLCGSQGKRHQNHEILTNLNKL